MSISYSSESHVMFPDAILDWLNLKTIDVYTCDFFQKFINLRQAQGKLHFKINFIGENFYWMEIINMTLSYLLNRPKTGFRWVFPTEIRLQMKVFSTKYAIIYQNLLILSSKIFYWNKIAILRVFDHRLNNNSRGKKVLRMSKEQQQLYKYIGPR